MEIDENSELKIESSNDTIAPSPSSSSKTTPEISTDPNTNLSSEIEKSDSDESVEATTSRKNSKKQKDYKLSAVVCEINDSNQKHLVALVYIGSSYHRMKLGDVGNRSGQWYIFNDFSIAPVSVQEAVWFTLDWKSPCVLFYSCCDFSPADNEVALDQFINPFVHVC